MVMTTARIGRTYFVAKINFENDRKLELLDEFYRVCSTFHYREVMALSRALGISDRTIRAWKYKETFPRWDIAVEVIDWVKRGKPMEKIVSRPIVDMF
jgi:hypothetical protein